MRIRPFGDSGALIEFLPEVTAKVHLQVTHLYRKLVKHRLPEVTNVIPAYHSITLSFDQSKITFIEIEKWIIQSKVENNSSFLSSKKFRIPVCYDPAFGLDQVQVASRSGKSVEEVVELHHSTIYRLYCIGFIPGFLYLGSLPSNLEGKRLANPRKSVPTGSVGIAGQQTGIYPAASPGGWEILGRCPVPTFLPQAVQPVPFEIGDSIEFFPITLLEYKEWKNREWDDNQYNALF